MKIKIQVWGIVILLLYTACNGETRDTGLPLSEELSILVFSKTAGFRHNSIEQGREAIRQMAGDHNVSAFFTEDASYFNEDSLSGFDAVIFLNTSGTIFDDDQRAAFKNYIQNGGGYAGTHSATDTEFDWPWYNKLAGAYFHSHPSSPNVRKAVLEITDTGHPLTEMLPDPWEREDEWYNFRDMNEDVNVVIRINTDSYEGSRHPGNHPISWYHEYDGGRAFYTAMGHTGETFAEEFFLQHLWAGIRYAMGVQD